jgi:hypothetical protein
MLKIVITSIQAPTPSVHQFAQAAQRCGCGMLVAGDRKTPQVDWPAPVEFMPIGAQRVLPFSLAGLLPENHYARKNLGYLSAIAAGASCIYDTDDDNAPLPSWSPRAPQTLARICREPGWVNPYAWFTSGEHIWPRGLPLEHARHGSAAPLAGASTVHAPVQQGLANGSPDVDAVWRLLLDRDITFADAPSVSLAAGCWAPFNSQSTWWFPDAYPLMYLPSFVSFRMTDIWRSFIAQRCLWAMDAQLVFHGPEVFQDRNEHNLLRDFEQEVPGYLENERFRQVLEGLALDSGEAAVGANLRRCYEALADAGLIEARELPLVDAWLRDVRAAGRPS